MLAHQRHRHRSARLFIRQVYLADPFCIGVRIAGVLKTMFIGTRRNAGITTAGTTIGIYQHAPTRLICDLFIILLGKNQINQANTRSQCEQSATSCRLLEELATRPIVRCIGHLQLDLILSVAMNQALLNDK